MATKLARVTERDEPNIDDAMARIMNNVSIERERNGETVKLVVENHSSTNESPDVTDIVDAEPRDVPEGATVVEMDGEWFVKWTPDVESGTEVALEYTVAADATFDLTVSEVEAAKLTVNK